MQNLDVLHLPLHGINLIEASAGTGKTYNLIIIYLRLLLNINKRADVFSRPLTVKEILVVTFTKAATQELRKRIQENIKQFQLDCTNGYSNNNLFSKLLLQIRDINLTIKLLSIAAKDINQASIYTIHGFCQKILSEYTIDLNISFHTTIIQDELTLYQQACSDFWRRNFYLLPLNIINFIQQYWKNPTELLKEIFLDLYKETPILQHIKNIDKSHEYILKYYTKIITCIKNIKKHWICNQYEIIDCITTYSTNHRTYNKNNLNRWTNIIFQWAKQETNDHITPNDLERFKLSELQTKKKITNSNILLLFNLIETLYQLLSSFRVLILDIAINETRKNLNITKYSESKITFNDLVDLLFQNIVKNKNTILIKKILQSYPIAIIDEFQDTDSNQYKIFYTLYSNQNKNSLILMGDPKQAIYGFRGADIYTYIKIRKLLTNKYNLNINWRSSPRMVNAINQLFQLPDPFLFKDIPFIPSISAYKNRMCNFFIHHKAQSPMCFWLHNHITTINDYKKIMAKECAIVIQNLLSHIYNKTAWLKTNKNEKKILQTSDITILVKNHEEASLVQSSLLNVNIPAVFLSNRKNIFETIESYELLLLLKSILYPKYQTICTAFTTIFFGLNIKNIEKMHNNKNSYQWNQIFSEFYEYYSIWKKNGIYAMIQKIIFQYKVPEKLLTIHTGKNNLINILHLGELLNSISQEIQNEYALVQWLEFQINKTPPHQNTSSNYSLRYDDDPNLIKISTIHKSKGLEFPITILPFIASFKYRNTRFFHNQRVLQSHVNVLKLNSILLDEERLSEDLRLLYVAITRSIYHCAIGIAPIIYKSYQKPKKITDLHNSSIGYLIQNKIPNTSTSLIQNLQRLNKHSNGDITFHLIPTKIHTPTFTKPLKNHCLSYTKYNSLIDIYNQVWRITSYSELKNHHNTKLSESNFQQLLNINLNNYFQENKSQSTLLTAHTFPKGKLYGIFFHNLFKNLDFKKSINIQYLHTQMMLYNIDLDWKTVIYQWIYTIIHTPLNDYNLTLSKIPINKKKTELKFHLNINATITAKELNYLCKYYDSLSLQSSKLTFEKFTGILKGFIDLIFYWNHKYYLLDYKTNWLGENNSFYLKKNIEQEIIKHHYELQYQLYTLAVHRFLQHRIISYNYEKNFGGIYYLFIRGMDGISTNHGVYFCRPSWEFIKKLDNLFLKKDTYLNN